MLRFHNAQSHQNWFKLNEQPLNNKDVVMNRKRQHVFITDERKLAREFAINVGYLIQHVRASKRLDQTELAERVGTSRATISRLERGLAMPNVNRNGKNLKNTG